MADIHPDQDLIDAVNRLLLRGQQREELMARVSVLESELAAALAERDTAEARYSNGDCCSDCPHHGFTAEQHDEMTWPEENALLYQRAVMAESILANVRRLAADVGPAKSQGWVNAMASVMAVLDGGGEQIAETDENWSAMCNESAPWQTPQQFVLCRLRDGHDGDHDRYGRTWQQRAGDAHDECGGESG